MKLEIEIPEGKKAEWVDGVLTLVDDKHQNTHVYKVGDKAVLNTATSFRKGDGICLITKGTEVEIIYASYPNPDIFDIKFENAISTVRGEDLSPVANKGITERIKTFEDACEWCTENGHHNIRREYDCIVTDTLILDEVSPDLIAYLKLRIITCALNEGWESTFKEGECRYWSFYNYHDDYNYYKGICVQVHQDAGNGYPAAHALKSQELAEYAANQFSDIYMNFCFKGKE